MVATEAGSLGLVALLWIMGALLTLFGALTVAELASVFPRPGGIYVYIKEAFGPAPAFVFGWTRLLVIQPALLGGIALIFAAYAETFLPLSELGVRALAAGAILVVGAANYRSMAWGAGIQNLSTAAKVLALGGLAGVIYALGDPALGSFGGAGIGSETPVGLSGLGVVLVSVLWAYDGWADATYVAGEVRDPGRSVPRALVGGFLMVVAVYLALNAAYLFVLTLPEMAGSEMVAADAARQVLGEAGGVAVAALVLLSTFGALNGTMMSGPRVFFAMARDDLFFSRVGSVHPRGRTPHVAITLASCLGIAFVSVRTFEQLAEAFILGLWPFFMLAVLAVLKLRGTRPELHRPYRTWGYPTVPIVFLLVSGAMLLNALWAQPRSSLYSFGVILTGVPVYLIWKRKRA